MIIIFTFFGIYLIFPCSKLECLIFQSGSEEEYSPFEHHWRPAKIPTCDLSDDESSGVSSTDNSLDNVLKGTH